MDFIYDKKAKLVGNVNEGTLCLLNSQDDWIHDQLDDSVIYHGTIYSFSKPFHYTSTSITGYFLDEETNMWLKVENGLASTEQSWKSELGELLTFSLATGKHTKYRINSKHSRSKLNSK